MALKIHILNRQETPVTHISSEAFDMYALLWSKKETVKDIHTIRAVASMRQTEALASAFFFVFLDIFFV